MAWPGFKYCYVWHKLATTVACLFGMYTSAHSLLADVYMRVCFAATVARDALPKTQWAANEYSFFGMCRCLPHVRACRLVGEPSPGARTAFTHISTASLPPPKFQISLVVSDSLWLLLFYYEFTQIEKRTRVGARYLPKTSHAYFNWSKYRSLTFINNAHNVVSVLQLPPILMLSWVATAVDWIGDNYLYAYLNCPFSFDQMVWRTTNWHEWPILDTESDPQDFLWIFEEYSYFFLGTSWAEGTN